MKKLLTVLLVLTAAICTALAFSACDISDLFGNNNNTDGTGDTTQDKGGDYYSVTVTGSGDHSFYEPLKDKYKAGEEVEVKLHVVTDISLFVYVNDERVTQSHYDSDYWGYKFTMPEEDIVILITSNGYHGVEICDFDRPFYWVKYLKTEDVVKIKCEKGYIGVQPDSLSDVVYTTDKTDIENICAVFDCKLIPNAERKDGGYYMTYTFYTADDSQYELYINNGCAVSISFSTSDYFEIADFTFPEIANPDSQCKKFNIGSCTVYSDAELKNRIDKHAYISLLEFDECEENTDGKTPSMYVDTRFGILKVIDDRTFIYGDITYKVTGEKDFSTIIY